MKNRILVALLAIICLMGVTISPTIVASAASESKVTITGDVKDYEQYQTVLEGYFDSWCEIDFADQVNQYKDQMSEDMVKKYNEWAQLKDEIGAKKEIISEDYSTVKDSSDYKFSIVVAFENGKIKMTAYLDSSMQPSDIQVEKYVSEDEKISMKDKLSKAGLNTVMSISIVFAMLIFIALIISLFKFIPMITSLFDMSKDAEVVEPAPAVAAPAVEAVDVTDDTEIVAVITAAIMASMGSEAPADGLHITSIKRRVNSKWRKSSY